MFWKNKKADVEAIHNDEATAKGVHIISVCDAKHPRAKALNKLIEENTKIRQWTVKNLSGKALSNRLHELWVEYTWYIEQLEKKFLVRQYYVENVTVTVGRSVFAQRLVNTITYTGIVNYGALGSDSTSPVVADTTLGTETYRKALSSGTFLNNIAYLENFYNATEVSGTFEEYGFFIDGTGSADTGQLFNRFTQTVVKSVTETLNVRSIITINDA